MRTMTVRAVSYGGMNRSAMIARRTSGPVILGPSIEALVAAADVPIEASSRDGLTAVLGACTEAAGIRESALIRPSSAGSLAMVAATSQEAARHVTPESLDAARRCFDSSEVVAKPFRSPVVPPDPLVRDGAPLAFRRGVFVPMRHQASPVAVLALFDRHEEPPTPDAIALVQGVADVAAAVLEHSRLLEAARILAMQLQEALESRVVLEQAKGMLAERAGSDPESAFRTIRDVARRERRAIAAVAADVVARRAGVGA